MKYVVRDNQSEPDHVLEFYLVQTNGGVELCARDSDGGNYSILSIFPGESITRWIIPKKLGLPVDELGRVLFSE